MKKFIVILILSLFSFSHLLGMLVEVKDMMVEVKERKSKNIFSRLYRKVTGYGSLNNPEDPDFIENTDHFLKDVYELSDGTQVDREENVDGTCCKKVCLIGSIGALGLSVLFVVGNVTARIIEEFISPTNSTLLQ